MNETYDTIVIGAGPAGASAAREIACNGVQVLLLSKEESPSVNKPCCGGLPKVVADRLNLPNDIIEKHINGFRSFSSKVPGKMISFSNPKCVTVYRRELDPFLAKSAVACGAKLKSNACAEKVIFDSEGGKDYNQFWR